MFQISCPPSRSTQLSPRNCPTTKRDAYAVPHRQRALSCMHAESRTHAPVRIHARELYLQRVPSFSLAIPYPTHTSLFAKSCRAHNAILSPTLPLPSRSYQYNTTQIYGLRTHDACAPIFEPQPRPDKVAPIGPIHTMDVVSRSGMTLRLRIWALTIG
jgi:hypothetical protein